jgi:hypothetical protein
VDEDPMLQDGDLKPLPKDRIIIVSGCNLHEPVLKEQAATWHTSSLGSFIGLLFAYSIFESIDNSPPVSHLRTTQPLIPDAPRFRLRDIFDQLTIPNMTRSEMYKMKTYFVKG